MYMCVCVYMCVQAAQSCLTLCYCMDCSFPGSSVHGILLGLEVFLQSKNTRVGCHLLFQGFFPAQGSNPGLRHCQQIRQIL